MIEGSSHRRRTVGLLGVIGLMFGIAGCAAVKCPAEDRPLLGGALLRVQEFSQLGQVSDASPSWKTRIRRADTSLLQLAHGFLPCREQPFDPYDTKTFCKRLEVEIPLLRESLERLSAEHLALEGEIAKRQSLGQNQVERDFQLRLYNFQNLLRRTDTVVMIYFDSSVMD